MPHLRTAALLLLLAGLAAPSAALSGIPLAQLMSFSTARSEAGHLAVVSDALCSSDDDCAASSACVEGACLVCGGKHGAPCCPGDRCRGDKLACSANGVCLACGAVGAPCCRSVARNGEHVATCDGKGVVCREGTCLALPLPEQPSYSAAPSANTTEDPAFYTLASTIAEAVVVDSLPEPEQQPQAHAAAASAYTSATGQDASAGGHAQAQAAASEAVAATTPKPVRCGSIGQACCIKVGTTGAELRVCPGGHDLRCNAANRCAPPLAPLPCGNAGARCCSSLNELGEQMQSCKANMSCRAGRCAPDLEPRARALRV